MEDFAQHRSVRLNGALDWCSCMNGTSGKEHDPSCDDECLLERKEDMEIIASVFSKRQPSRRRANRKKGRK